MKVKNVLWGLVLILTGILFILRNIGVINFSWFNFLQLWPAIFVLWGISLLPLKEYLKIVLIVVVLGIFTVFVLDSDNNWNIHLLWNNNDNMEYFESYQDFSLPYNDSVTTAHLELDAAAGSFIINDTTNDMLYFEKHGGGSNYDYISSITGNKTNIQISRKKHHFSFNEKHHKIYIQLNPNPVWDIDLEAGASSVKYDLSQFKVNSININSGASSFNLKLGKLYPKTDVTIDAGASSFKINIPESAGCDMVISSVFSGKNFVGFNKIGTGHYRTSNYDSATQKIDINIDAAVSSYTIIRY